MRAALEELVERYGDSLYAVAFNVCGNRADAEDVLQETFLRYHRSDKEFEDEQHLRAWLIRVAVNAAKDVRRSFWHRNRVSLQEYMESAAFDSQESRDLFEAVMSLPEKYRIVIHLYYYEDYSVREIAGILKLTEGNVRVRLSRGRTLLRQQLKEGWDDEGGDE